MYAPMRLSVYIYILDVFICICTCKLLDAEQRLALQVCVVLV
jgi:hypothetical protein